MFAKPVKMLQEDSRLTTQCHPAALKHPAYGRVLPGRLMTMGVAVLCTTTHRNGSWFEGLISMCGRKRGDMNKISGLCTRDGLSSFSPANLADARKNVRDRLLFPVMMNSRQGSWFHFEQPAPDGRRNTEPRRDRGTTLGARRLRCCPIAPG
jgi:hypothetical protein